MDSNWPRWIIASINQHLVTKNTSNYVMQLLDQPLLDLSSISQWIEVRMAGPVFTLLHRDTLVQLELNVLVQTIRALDGYRYARMDGAIASWLTDITLYKYGDSGDAFGCLARVGEIQTRPLPNAQLKTTITQSIVSTRYEAYLQ